MGRALKILIMMTTLLAPCFAQDTQQSPLDELKRKAQEIIRPKGQGTNALSNDKIVAGLREALAQSTKKAVASTGRPDGFLKNAAIKILLPEKLRTVGKGMRMVGMGAQVDELEVGMNRAAEQAAPAAKQIFLNSLSRMTFQDARQILTGGDTAATDYFKRTSTDQLTTAFAPIVHKAMLNVGVIRQYNRLMQNPMVANSGAAQDLNIDNYVVGKTLDGLFYVMGQEEKNIRQDPMGQASAILREVFGAAAQGR